MAGWRWGWGAGLSSPSLCESKQRVRRVLERVRGSRPSCRSVAPCWVDAGRGGLICLKDVCMRQICSCAEHPYMCREDVACARITLLWWLAMCGHAVWLNKQLWTPITVSGKTSRYAESTIQPRGQHTNTPSLTFAFSSFVEGRLNLH